MWFSAERCSGGTQAAPGVNEDASSKLWLYRSLMTQQTDANSGLVGPIIISKASAAAADGSPSDVDVELITLFQVGALARLIEGYAGKSSTRAASQDVSGVVLSTPCSQWSICHAYPATQLCEG